MRTRNQQQEHGKEETKQEQMDDNNKENGREETEHIGGENKYEGKTNHMKGTNRTEDERYISFARALKAVHTRTKYGGALIQK